MTARGVPAVGRAAAQNELLARLGLPVSSSPEDVDRLHQAVTEYLAAAPSAIRGWAHAQAAALDEAYLQLIDPVGLQGSALRSPGRAPAVVPGGPATPPARRESRRPLHAVPAPLAEDPAQDAASENGADLDDEDALFASVTPSAHRDMVGDGRSRAREAAATAAVVGGRPGRGRLVRNLVLGGAAVGLAVAIALVGYNLGGAGSAQGANGAAAEPSAEAPAIDEAKVAALMEKLQANPNDRDTLLALANEFYAGEQFDVAGNWLDKLLKLDPGNVQALLARGAVSFNLGDMTAAEKDWKRVVELDAKNVEAHYDLGFLYLNSATPDIAAVRREWTKVVELGPGTDLAKTVQTHLDQLAQASFGPGASGSAAPSASAAPSGSAAPSASTDPASPAPSAAPASPAASPAP